MKASDVVAMFLESQDIPCVFELVGGMITHLLDSLHEKTSIGRKRQRYIGERGDR